METLPRAGLARAQMMKRVARFKDLRGSDGGLPDSKMKGCIRTLYNVIGFQPPPGEGDAVTSPVGDEASRLAAIPISEGFNLGYCRAKPGNGPMMHNHDTNETFIPMTGRGDAAGRTRRARSNTSMSDRWMSCRSRRVSHAGSRTSRWSIRMRKRSSCS